MSVQELVAPPRPQLAGGRLVWVLGLGAFGLAFSITTLTFLPVELGHFTSSRTLIALVLVADGPMAFCLLLMPFMPNLWTTALVVFAFFFAYYVYEPPYRGLYPDLLSPAVFGKAQGVQHVLRGLALGGALVGGGFLLDLWMPAPFLVAAVVTAAACAAVIVFVREDGGHGRVFRGFRAYLSTSWCIVREEAEVRSFLIANAAWEGTFAAARIFVVLYVTRGLHESPRIASLVLATVAGGYVVAAVWSGRVADRIGLGRVIFFCSFVYGGGPPAGGWGPPWPGRDFGLIFPVAVAGGAGMTQAGGLLFKPL